MGADDAYAYAYAGIEHQLCCAHVLRETQAVAEAAPPNAQWCWATQAADALVAMQTLVAETITAGADSVDTDALAKQVHLYRSTAQVGDHPHHRAVQPPLLRHPHHARRGPTLAAHN